jgi:outer membrane protein assembly factor BamB
VIKFDADWRRLEAWVFPAGLVERFASYSSSGGAFGPDGRLYVTGHDATELYVLEFPEAGSVLRWVETIPISAEGQAFAWDPSERGVLWTILKRTREVIVGRVTPK